MGSQHCNQGTVWMPIVNLVLSMPEGKNRPAGTQCHYNIWPILMKVAQLVFFYRTRTDLLFHGFYLDKCIDLIEGFHAIHSFSCRT